LPALEEAYISAAPAQKNDGIPVGALGVDGGNRAMILKLANQLAANEDNKYDSLLIAHKGKLLFESYYAKGRINLPHPMASTTKAYTGLALGRAIQLGYLSLADLHQPLVEFLPELDPGRFVAGVDQITLHHALSMRSGLRIEDQLLEAWQANPEQLTGQRQVQAYFEHTAPVTPTSQTFRYQFDPDLVMQVLDAVVPGSAEDFIANELLAKLGISDYRWRTGISGLPSAGSGSSMTSRDMIKWGTLVMNGGQWHGEQLIPEAFIRTSTDRQLLTGDDDIYGGGKDVSKQGYGYYWWSADLQSGDTTHLAVSAQGGGGQFIILVEDLELLVVVTALDNDNTTLQLLAEQILPAFQ
jgi:CubicO group peptidase (beta-lactamase class C family)